MMRTVIFVFVASCSFVGIAQTNQGRLFIGASTSLDLSYEKSPPSQSASRKEFELNMDGGFFVKDGLALGVSYSFMRSELHEFLEQAHTVKPFVRYFFGESFFAGAGYGVRKVRTENPTYSLSGDPTELFVQKFNLYDLEFEVGRAIWLRDRITLEPTVNYRNSFRGSIKVANELGLNIGFNYYF